MKRALLIAGGTVGGLGAVLSITPPQFGSSSTVAGGIQKTTPTPTAAPTPAAAKAAASGPSGTFMGDSINTQFGPVQIQITISGGKITHVAVPVYPNSSGRDQQINSQAVPWLIQEAMKAQSSNIQGVGGASYTSQGFYDSLVSALAKAGMK